jgi:hypothetical protein
MGDGKPMVEDALNRGLMFYAIAPLQSHLTPRLQGQQNCRYQSMPLQDNRMFSVALNLELVVVGENLCF